MQSLFTPYDLGPIRLKNRIVMPPMIRTRTSEGGLPTQFKGEPPSDHQGEKAWI